MTVEAVIAAAGLSRRVGRWKPGLPFGGKTLIEAAVAPYLEVCQRVIVVGGFNFDELRRILGDYEKIEIVFNPDYTGEMFLSVKTGVSRVKAGRFFFTPGDYPLVKAETLRKLLHSSGEVVVPVFGGRRGHPVLMDSSLIPELMDEPDSSSLKAFLRKKEITEVEVDDPGVRLDVDTWEDYQKLLRLAGQG